MARRRLQAILATTVITVGLSSGPALAQEFAGLTDTLEETVTRTTDEVTSATDEVVDTVTGLTGEQSANPEPVEETATEGTTTEGTAPEQATVAEDAAEDDPLIDLGTGDGTLDVELDVDVAPSDEDGSPQLEVDGVLSVGGERVDVGAMTDPIEDVVDPDEPAPAGDTSSDRTTTPRNGGSGGFIAGGGVVAAGDDARPATTGTDAPDATPGNQGFSLVGGDGSVGLQRFGGGTMDLDRAADPEVAPPADAPGDAGELDELPEAPEVADDRTQAILATESPTGDDSPLATLLRALAGALVLATGAAWTRMTRDA